MVWNSSETDGPHTQQEAGNGRSSETNDLFTHTADVEIETPVLIVGGGPVGMLLAYSLSAHYGQPCALIEQEQDTTIYPKMELTQGRAMEIYRFLGVVDELRSLGVAESENLDELITTGLGKHGYAITRWKRESPLEIRQQSSDRNDGTFPREPYLRCVQIKIEKWLKGLISKEEKVKSFWGWKFLGLEENGEGVISEAVNSDGKRLRVKSQYVIGCDGAGSAVRRSIKVEAPRSDMGFNMTFVHFESKDFETLRSQGKFWHCMTLAGGAFVDQGDGVWTLHRMMPPDGGDLLGIDPVQLIAESAGGLGGASPVKVDRVIVKGKWSSGLSVAKAFRSQNGRVFLAGDAAHPLSPVGGHGLNTGICDVWDLGWKLSATLNGWGGPHLLSSYDVERRPVAHNNAAMVVKAAKEVALPILVGAQRIGGETLTAQNESGASARTELGNEIDQGHWMHNQVGKILGFRYVSSIILKENEVDEPETEITRYIPTTWPGGRPPHVFLSDGKTSIFDLFGKGFSLIDFTQNCLLGDIFSSVSHEKGIPITVIHLPNESHVRQLWERDTVLIRPDGHVAWRSPLSTDTSIGKEAVASILAQASGN